MGGCGGLNPARGCGCLCASCCPCIPGHCAQCSEQSGFRKTSGDRVGWWQHRVLQAAASPAASPGPRPVPRATRQGCTGIPNGIKSLLARSSHPNPSGRLKVSLGQKALAVHAWPWPLTSVQAVGPGQQPQSPHCWVVTATGQPLDTAGDTAATWGPQPCQHWMWECGVGTAPLGVSGTSWESSCCPAKFLFFSEIHNSVSGKKQMRAEQVPGPVQGSCKGTALAVC